MAFVLNKWDRDGIGLQYDRRAVVEDDFRRLLAESGFESPVLFKVSSLYGAQHQPSGTASTRSPGEHRDGRPTATTAQSESCRIRDAPDQC